MESLPAALAGGRKRSIARETATAKGDWEFPGKRVAENQQPRLWPQPAGLPNTALILCPVLHLGIPSPDAGREQQAVPGVNQESWNSSVSWSPNPVLFLHD
jgi:hypothetical protein